MINEVFRVGSDTEDGNLVCLDNLVYGQPCEARALD